jgi:hypothetical protein
MTPPAFMEIVNITFRFYNAACLLEIDTFHAPVMS